MNGDRSFPEESHINISKKANPIDDQPVRKKGKKNRNKKDQHQSHSPPPNNLKDPPSHHQPKKMANDPLIEQKRIVQELSDIFSTFKANTVQKIVKECRFNKEDALEKLLSMQPDGQQENWGFEQQNIKHKQAENSNKQADNSSTSHSEAANNLMNQMYDGWIEEDINGLQFQQLFEEIAQMIADDQKKQGVGVFEINSFVDQCNSVKQALLVGFKQEFSNQDQLLSDQSSPLYAQTQQFLQQKIKKMVRQQQKRQQDFPTLSGGKGCNIVQRIRNEHQIKKQQQQLFTPSRNPVPQFARQRNNGQSIFNIDNRLRSQKDMVALHKQFVNVPIYDLKFCYRVFGYDYNICRQFLIKYYDSKRINVYRDRPETSSKPVKRIITNNLAKQEIDKQVEHLSYDELRDEIDHLFKLRQALQLTKMKIRGSAQKVQLDRLINAKQPIIRKLAQASRLKLVQDMAKRNPLYVDLHGYRQQQLDSLLDSVSDMVRSQFQRGSEKVKTSRVRGRLTACLVIMTGKGLHSRGNRSILKPAVLQWCQRRRFEYEQDEDHVRAYVLLS